MKISCVHCGQPFTITAEQLGGRGRCPHCRATITLPRADAGPSGDIVHDRRPSSLIENSVSALGSCVIHMTILIILGLIPWGGQGIGGDGDEVLIGQLPTENLSREYDSQLEPDDSRVREAAEEALESPIDDVQQGVVTNSESLDDLPVSLSPSGSGNAFSLETVQSSQAATGGEDFDGLIERLQRDGLDICIVFDSTGSMSGEILEVKSQIDRISSVLLRLVPKTRISIVTYRDDTEQFRELYVVKGLPLSSDMQQVSDFLDDIYASGGGDTPEAVEAGLEWAVENNRFRSRARKVILLFGDAPPHRSDHPTCLRLATDFRIQQGGIVSTVTCRHTSRLEEFVEIAQMGGGEAFLTRDEREIMTQLIVLVFGSEHRDKVLEAFDLLER